MGPDLKDHSMLENILKFIVMLRMQAHFLLMVREIVFVKEKEKIFINQCLWKPWLTIALLSGGWVPETSRSFQY